MLYLDLIRTWGDVVFVTEPSKSTDDFFSVGVTERNKILEYLIDELIDVEPMMKYAADLDYGVERASREYCQALIGQLALYRGSPRLFQSCAQCPGRTRAKTPHPPSLSVPPFLQVYMYIWSIIAQMIYICLTIILTS